MKKFNTKFSLLLMLFSFTYLLKGQNIAVTQHNLDDFHSNPPATYFAEDSQGNIWVLQWGGFSSNYVLKYDGNTWEQVPFDACDHCARRLVNNKDGIVYLGTTSGIFSWNGSSWEQKSNASVSDTDMAFDSQNRLWLKPNGSNAALASLTQAGMLIEHLSVTGDMADITVAPDDKVWLRKDGLVVSFDGTNLVNFPGVSNPLHIEAAADGKIWVTNSFGEVSYIQNGAVTNDVLNGTLESGVSQTAFAIDRLHNAFWFGQQGIEPGLVFYNGNATELVPSDDMFNDPFSPGLVNRAFVASDGSLWAASQMIGAVAEIKAEFTPTIEPYFTETAIYPNPANQTIYLNSSMQQAVPVFVCNKLGQIVLETELMPTNGLLTLGIGALSDGQYFISIPAERKFGSVIVKH